MASVFLETPTFGGEWCPQVRFRVDTNNISSTEVRIDWSLEYDGNGDDPKWDLHAFIGYTDGSTGSEHGLYSDHFASSADDREVASGSFTMTRKSTDYDCPMFLSIDMSSCEYGGEYGQDWEGDNAIMGESFSVGKIEPPSAPKSISGSRVGDSITISLDNPSNDATGTQVQIRTETGSWANLVSTTTGGPITGGTYSIPSFATGKVYLQARNYANSLYSAWVEAAEPIQLPGAPNPPTVVEPHDGATVIMGDKITFKWAHNPTDGTEQTYARIYVDGEYTLVATAYCVYDGKYYTYSMPASYSKDTTHSWYITTRGESTKYSATTATRSFTVRSAPAVTLNVTSLSEGTQTNLPIEWSVVFGSASSGSFASQTAVLRENGVIIAKKELKTRNGSFTFGDVNPTSRASLKLTVTVRSSYGLSTTVSKTFDYINTGTMPALIDFNEFSDHSTYYQMSLAYFLDERYPAPTKAYLYRVHDGVETLIRVVNQSEMYVFRVTETINSGVIIRDYYAPGNVEYSYRAVFVDENSGAMSRDWVDEVVVTRKKWRLNYGGKWIDKEWNATGSWSVKRPSKEVVFYDGRELPVVYDGANIERTFSISFELLTIDEVNEINDLIKSGGKAYFMSCDGFCGWVSVEAQFSPKYTDHGHYGTVTLSMTQIDGDLK